MPPPPLMLSVSALGSSEMRHQKYPLLLLHQNSDIKWLMLKSSVYDYIIHPGTERQRQTRGGGCEKDLGRGEGSNTAYNTKLTSIKRLLMPLFPVLHSRLLCRSEERRLNFTLLFSLFPERLLWQILLWPRQDLTTLNTFCPSCSPT